MHSNTFVNVNCFLDGCARITLEEWVRLGPHVKILTGTHSYENSVLRRSPRSKNINLPVVIKRGSWVGMGAMLLPGVTIGEGCIIAAGAVVIKSTLPNGLYAGNPAKRLKDLPT
ncbi:acyltransferase [Noviherbaspirillum soli]|uniref:acyltransferase n=1 Tax=Noviherbaspirillum soli TaxID=1064518 RepID=UPI0038992D18